MFVVGNILFATANIVHTVLRLAYGLFLVRIVLSWVRPSPPPGIVRKIIEAIYDLTDPVLERTRRLLPFLQVGGLDLSPIVVFLAIGFVDSVVTRSLMQAAAAM